MAERKSFLLRIDAEVLDAVKKWADDDLRSLNAQIEYLLRKALRERGRLRESSPEPAPPQGAPEQEEPPLPA
jgi:hypothetical protein